MKKDYFPAERERKRRTGGLARKLKFCQKLNKQTNKTFQKLNTQIISKSWTRMALFDKHFVMASV